MATVLITPRCSPETRSWMLCCIWGTLYLGTKTCKSSIWPFSSFRAQYTVPWSLHSECHWAHKIFSSLDWTKISTQLASTSCSLASRMGPISPTSNRAYLCSIGCISVNFLTHTVSFFSMLSYFVHSWAQVSVTNHRYFDVKSLSDAGSGNHIPGVFEYNEKPLFLLGFQNLTADVRGWCEIPLQCCIWKSYSRSFWIQWATCPSGLLKFNSHCKMEWSVFSTNF